MKIPSTHASMLLALRKDDRQEEAWAAFQARYSDVILSWCQRRDLFQGDAEDLTQDVLLKLFQQLATYDPAKGRFRSWLQTVVNNAITDWKRRQQRQPEHRGIGGTAFQEQLARLETPETADELSVVIERQAKAITAEVSERIQARVEAKTWQAFYQTTVEQRPVADVAAALGLTPGAVHKYKFRVKQMLIQEYANVHPAS